VAARVSCIEMGVSYRLAASMGSGRGQRSWGCMAAASCLESYGLGPSHLTFFIKAIRAVSPMCGWEDRTSAEGGGV